MGETATGLTPQARHDLTLTRSIACPACTSYTFRVTFSFVGDQMFTSGKCLACGFQRGAGDQPPASLEGALTLADQGQVDTPSAI